MTSLKLFVSISFLTSLIACEHRKCSTGEYRNSLDNEVRVVEYTSASLPQSRSELFTEHIIMSGDDIKKDSTLCADNLIVDGSELGVLLGGTDSLSIFIGDEMIVTYYADWTRQQDDIRSGDGLGPYYIQNWVKRVENDTDIYTYIIDESIFD